MADDDDDKIAGTVFYDAIKSGAPVEEAERLAKAIGKERNRGITWKKFLAFATPIAVTLITAYFLKFIG